MRYAVTGATGELGRLVVKTLQDYVAAQDIVALVRNPEKAADIGNTGVHVRMFDYDRPETLAGALAGVDRLLLISATERGRRVAQHRAVIDAAVEAGVGLLVYTSLLNADSSPLQLAGEHVETEAYLKASGLPFVILRNSWYSENYTAQIPSALRIGVLLGAAGDGRIASAPRADFAAAAAAVLTTEHAATNTTFELAGDEAFTLAEFAAELSLQAGTAVPYQDLPKEQYEQILLTKAQLPADLAALIADSDDGAAKGGLYHDGRDLSRLIGRPTTTLSQSIADALHELKLAAK